MKLIGYGGKDGADSQLPVESPDTLISPSYAMILDLLCEGEIDGLIDDASDAASRLKSVYLNGTPVRNADGSYNFKSIGFASVPGTQAQDVIAGFSDVETPHPSFTSQAVTHATPIVATISDVNADAAIITIEVPQLYMVDIAGVGGADPTGDMLPTEVEVKIELQANGGGYVVQNIGESKHIRGKCLHPYDRQYRIELTGAAPWDIRVSRVTLDNGSSTLLNQTTWKALTQVVDAKLNYPNSALVGLVVPATQFSTPPERSYLVKGLKVKVPTNYDPLTRVYTGVWDGTFKIAWTDNPAWCFYDLLTTSRYGLGRYLDSASVDKWGLYTIAQYCDQLVPDGKGGTEPRFTCNLLIQAQAEAYQAIRDFASIFRSMVYWASGAIQTSQDSPQDPTYLFTPANVVNGAFSYTSSAKRARHTVAIVSWNDPAQHYQSTREYVTDELGLATYGYNPIELSALGCSSQGQAQRVGRWLLYTERLETETVTFATGLEGALRVPGAIVTVQDPYRAGVRNGGRLASGSTLTDLVLDADITLPAGTNYVSVLLQDGTIQERQIASAAGVHRKLALAVNLPALPAENGTWILRTSTLSPVQYRVLSVNDNADGTYQVIALRHDPNKFVAVEDDIFIQPASTSIIPSSLSPTGLTVTEALYKSTAGIKVRLQAGWDQNPAATKYSVKWRRDLGNWSSEEIVESHFWELLDITPGPYWVQVQALLSGGVRTDSVRAEYTVLGKTAAPADVTGLTASVSSTAVVLKWNQVADVDLDYYEVRVGGTDWASATFVGAISATSFVYAATPATAYTLRVKAVDTSGNYSANAASATATTTTVDIPDHTISTTKFIEPPALNLVPNGYSEAGTAAVGMDPEGNGLVNDAAHAFEGNWCRKYIDPSSGNFVLAFTKDIPCTPGEQFYASAQIRAELSGAAGSYYLHARIKNASGTEFSFPTATVITPTTTYQQRKFSFTAPAGAVSFRLCFDNSGAGAPADGGRSFYIDTIECRRMVTFDLIAANTLETSNYAEDGSGNPTAGAKLDSLGTAVKVGDNGLQIGSHLFDDIFFRSLQALDGNWSTARAFYRGNNDPTVRGGAPNIDCLTIYASYDAKFSPGGTFLFQVSRWTFVLQPSTADDNLDAMRYMHMTPYHGTASGATAAHDVDITVPDRLYYDPTDTNTGNAVSWTWDQNYSQDVNSFGSTSPFWYLFVTLYNAYGPSESRWFKPASAADGAMVRQTASPFTGGSSGGGGGGGGTGFGGTCPAPWEMILMADGTEKAAKDIRPGMEVMTMHEHSFAWGKHRVTHAFAAVNMHYRVTFTDGRKLDAAWNHRVRVVDIGWVDFWNLKPGMLLEGKRRGVVRSAMKMGFGPVVKLTIAGAHTYVVNGLLSHNAKPR